MKSRVFGSDRVGFAYNTMALEDLLKEELGETTRLSDVTFPRYGQYSGRNKFKDYRIIIINVFISIRVLISAVNKKTTPPTLHFFNNCFDNEFSNGKCLSQFCIS